MDRYKFGDFIYQKRKALGLTQEELGRKLGVTNKAVSKWEVGETTPDITVLEPLASIFNVTVDELLLGKEQKVENKKKVKINKLLLIFVIMLSILELLTIICFSASIVGLTIHYKEEINAILNHEEKVLISQENALDYIEVLPMTNFTNDGQKINISSQIKTKKDLVISQPISFVIYFKVNYYYYDANGKLGVVTYTRNISGELTNELTTYDALIELEPKTEILDYEYLSNVIVEFEINNVSGEITLK